jgi:hypothetical protein
MCKEEKIVYIDKSISRQNNTKYPINNIQIKNVNNNLNNIMTLEKLKVNNNCDDLGKPKIRRFNKESELETLKKISMASDQKNKKNSNIQNIKDKKFVSNLRNPGKFNAETFQREYGQILK